MARLGWRRRLLLRSVYCARPFRCDRQGVLHSGGQSGRDSGLGVCHSGGDGPSALEEPLLDVQSCSRGRFLRGWRILGALLFALGKTSGVFCLSAILFGVFTGGFFFYLVFHGLAHPSKSARYVGINESVVGITSLAAPALGGFIGQVTMLSVPYYLSAALIFAVMFLLIKTHRARPFPR